MNSDHRPFFSVLITSYNRPNYIAECVESVLANEGQDYELIISDDASPSSSAVEAAMQPYLTHLNVRFYKQKSNLGEPGNRNFLVSQARGEYNIILCDDDKLLPHALQTIRGYIERQSNQDLYMFGYKVVNEAGVACYDRVAPMAFGINLDHPKLIRSMFEATWLPFLAFHPATFCCKRGIEIDIPYRQDVFTADDYMFLLECLNKGKRMYVLPECLMSYRWVLSSQGANQVNQSADNFTVLKAYTQVYYAFQDRKDLRQDLSDLISGSEYRKRFLYDLIIRRNQTNKQFIRLLNLKPAHYQELLKYLTRVRRSIVLIKTGLGISFELTQHFGLQGLMYSIRICLTYLLYRVSVVSRVLELTFSTR